MITTINNKTLDLRLKESYDNTVMVVATSPDNNLEVAVLWFDRDGTILRNVAAGEGLEDLGFELEHHGVKVRNP